MNWSNWLTNKYCLFLYHPMVLLVSIFLSAMRVCFGSFDLTFVPTEEIILNPRKAKNLVSNVS